MNNQKQNIEALKNAIKEMGSQQKLVDLFKKHNYFITQGAVNQWLTRKSVSFQAAYLIDKIFNKS